MVVSEGRRGRHSLPEVQFDVVYRTAVSLLPVRERLYGEAVSTRLEIRGGLSKSLIRHGSNI